MFSVSIEDKGFSQAVAKAAALAVADFAPELDDMGKMALAAIIGGFVLEVDPYGNAWKPLTRSTIRSKLERGSRNAYKILQDTGELKASFKHEVVEEGVSLFTGRRFPDGTTAEIHQFGGSNAVSGNFIPAREMLPFSEGLPESWVKPLEAFTVKGVDRIFK